MSYAADNFPNPLQPADSAADPIPITADPAEKAAVRMQGADSRFRVRMRRLRRPGDPEATRFAHVPTGSEDQARIGSRNGLDKLSANSDILEATLAESWYRRSSGGSPRCARTGGSDTRQRPDGGQDQRFAATRRSRGGGQQRLPPTGPRPDAMPIRVQQTGVRPHRARRVQGGFYTWPGRSGGGRPRRVPTFGPEPGHQSPFPTPEVGRSNRLPTGKIRTVPADPQRHFGLLPSEPGMRGAVKSHM